MYEQLVASRQRLAKQLSEKSRAITSLEQRLTTKDEQLRRACMRQVLTRLAVQSLQLYRLCLQAGAGGLQESGHRHDGAAAAGGQCLRIHHIWPGQAGRPRAHWRPGQAPAAAAAGEGLLHVAQLAWLLFGRGPDLLLPWEGQAHADAVGALAACVPREVPVGWYGLARDVRVMGDFDGWSRGFDLSAEDISDDVFTHFEALVPLPKVRDCTRRKIMP